MIGHLLKRIFLKARLELIARQVLIFVLKKVVVAILLKTPKYLCVCEKLIAEEFDVSVMEKENVDGVGTGSESSDDVRQATPRPHAERPTISTTYRRMVGEILSMKSKGDESLRCTLLYKGQRLTLSGEMLHDSFKINGTIVDYVMDAYGKFLNHISHLAPVAARHSYIMLATYLVLIL
ncbi:uncharacterized protein LOC110724141 [Chenopodium quinoa]|uniref:uncharacterized protein LOC110724141 n=1 Tax=Chenopodium quinoa TaxID=63459 RepID=UPI000B78CAFE|nr:uncharacterized protein LOC110724141 [Chenopodium quinoa]